MTRSIASLRERIEHGSRRGRPVMLANGLAVYADAHTNAQAIHRQAVDDYFRPDFQLRPNMTVVDVGANIGMFSLEVLQRCGGDVRLLAVEPAAEPFAYLERNIRELFPRSRVTLLQCALADRFGQATFFYRPRMPVISSLQSKTPGDSAVFIEGVLQAPPAEERALFPRFHRLPRTLRKAFLQIGTRWIEAQVVETPCAVETVSRVLREHGIERVDFLKIDVEGAELDVLCGIEQDDWPKIQRLAAEVHDLDGRVETIRGMLERAGFEHIEVSQEWPFEGTEIWMLHARRAS
jgi:FkbM family methyltransferase